MKQKILLILILVLVGMAAVMQASAQPSISVSVSKYDPNPAVPGQTVRVWFLVQNNGEDSAQDIYVTLIPQYPFTIYSDNATKYLQLLGGHRDYLIDYTLKVDDNAIQGNNNLKMLYNDSSTLNSQTEYNFDIFVQSQDTTLAIDSVQTSPSQVEPGSQVDVTISVRNLAQTPMTDITSKLILEPIIGGTIIDLPFAPMDSGAERKLFRLNPGDVANFTYTLTVYPDAASKVYKIPFTLDFFDTLGNEKNSTDYIGLIVNSQPDVSIYVDKTDLVKQKRSGTVTLKVVNKGLSDVKFLNVIFGQSPDYELLSTSDTTYVGNLVSDDYQTVDYTMNILSNADNITLPVTLQYRDSNNQYYERKFDVPLKLIDNTKLNQANQAAGGSFLWTGIIIIVIAGAIWLYLRGRAKKNKKAEFR